MSKLHAHIEQLEQQVMQLLARSNEQKIKLQKLEQENETLKKKLQQQDNQKISLINQDAIRQWLSEQPKANNQEILSHYISTINDCIAFLENLATWKN
jgi:hypothetical protein